VKAFLQRHRLVLFFLFAFLLSWYPWIIALTRGRTSGPNPLGPLVAGIIVTAIVSGRSGLREFFSRLVRWRVSVKWYAIVFGMPVLICLVAVVITLCFVHDSHVSALSIEKLRDVPERFLFILLFIGLGEEPGWRGFALPQLQTKHSPLIASGILAPIWALWHLPLVGNEFPLPIVAPFVLSVFGGTFHADMDFQWHQRQRVVADVVSRNDQHGRRRINFSALPERGARPAVVDLRRRLAVHRSRRAAFQREKTEAPSDSGKS